jgi:hypothetical protein
MLIIYSFFNFILFVFVEFVTFIRNKAKLSCGFISPSILERYQTWNLDKYWVKTIF